MGRRGGKKYRREIRKEQSERDKDALFWKLGKQLSDPLGEYRQFIANLRNKEINEVDDFIDIPINLIDLTANLITSLITGENCLYESINESDKRLAVTYDLEEDLETKKITRRKSKSHSRETTASDTEEKNIKITKSQHYSNSNSIKKNKSYSFNFEEYCHHENKESFYFIRKIIKKTQLSLTTFIVSLYFIYNYKHLEKDKRKHRENKVQKYISDWPISSLKKSNKKKKRKRKNKNKNYESISAESSGMATDKGTPSSQDSVDLKNEIHFKNPEMILDDSNKNQNIKYPSNKTPVIEISHDFINQNNSLLLSNNENNDKISPILKSDFLSSFKPRNQDSSSVSNSSSMDSKLTVESFLNNNTNNLNNNTNNLNSGYPSLFHTNKNDKINCINNYDKINNINKNEKNNENNENNENNNNFDTDNDENENEDEEEDENEDEDEDNNNEDEDEDDNYNEKKERQYNRHKRFNSQLSNIIKNENLSKNFSYLSSCYILSDRYGSYVIPTFLASIIVADKLLYDATYTNLNWSEFTEGRYSLEDINELERRFLSIMNFQLFISQKKFDEFLSYLDFILCLQKIRAWGSIPFSLSYSDIYTLTKKMDTKYFNAYPNNNNNNIYETIKFIFKIILGILLIYILLFFFYLMWKNHNS